MKISPRPPRVGHGAKLRTADGTERRRAICVCRDLVHGTGRIFPRPRARDRARQGTDCRGKGPERGQQAQIARRRPQAPRHAGPAAGSGASFSSPAPPGAAGAYTQTAAFRRGKDCRAPGRARIAPSCPATASGRCRRRGARARAAFCPGWPPCPRGAPRTPRWRRLPAPS